MKKIITIVMLFTLVSCATHERGIHALVQSGDHPQNFPIRGFIDENYSNENFQLVNIHFQNLSDKWIRVKSAKIIKLDDSNIVSVTKGKDLESWKKSFLEMKSIENYNDGVSFAGVVGLMAFGAVAAVIAGEPEIGDATMALTELAVVGKTASQIDEVGESLETAKLTLDNHVSKEFSVAPGMITRRWVLIQKHKTKDLNKIEFSIDYETGKNANYSIALLN